MTNRFLKYLAQPAEAGAALLKRPTAHRPAGGDNPPAEPTAAAEPTATAQEPATYDDVRPENPALDMQEAPEETTPEGETLIESVLQGVLRGREKGVQSMLDLSADVVEGVLPESMITGERIQRDIPHRSNRLPGQIVEGITQFGLSMVPAGRAVKAIKVAGWAAKTAKLAGQAAIADFLAFGEAEPRLANMLVTIDNPAFSNAVTRYLAADPDDGWAEGRFKNVLEGLVLGTAAGVLWYGIRGLKAAIWAKGGTAKGTALRAGTDQMESSLDAMHGLEGTTQGGKGHTAAGGIPNDGTWRGAGSPQWWDSLTEVEKATKSTRVAMGDLTVDLTEIGMTHADAKEISRRVTMARAGQISWDDALGRMPLPGSANALTDDSSKVLISFLSAKIREQAGDIWDNPQTIETVRQMAVELAMDPALVIRRIGELGSQREIVAANVLAARGLEQSIMRNMLTMARKVKSGTARPDEFHDLAGMGIGLIGDIRQAGSTLGRGTHALGIPVGIIDSSASAKIRELVKNFDGDKDAFLDGVAQITDPGALARVMRVVFSNATWDVINEVWVNALLSGPRTHMINMTSNTIKMLVTPASDAAGYAFLGDFGKSKDALDMYSGLVQAGYDSMRMFKHAMKKGDNILDPMHPVGDMVRSKAIGKAATVRRASATTEAAAQGLSGKLARDFVNEQVGIAGRAQELVGDIGRLPTQSLLAEDEFFKQMNYRARVRVMATREAKNLGLKGGEFAEHVARKMEDAFDVNMAGTNAEALRYAQDTTFTNNLEYGIGMHLQKMAREYPAMKQLFPFIRTPTNLFRDAYRHFPLLGLLEKKHRAALVGAMNRGPGWKNDELAKLVGKQMVGGGILTTVTALTVNGRITGGGPKDPALREAWLNVYQPYSIKIGDTWHSYERLDPIGMVFGVMADFAEIASDLTPDEADELGSAMLWSFIGDVMDGDEEALGTLGDTLGGGIMATAKNATSKVYLTSISDLLEVITTDDAWKWNKYIRNRASSFVPNLLRQGNPDNYMREVRTVLDAFKARIPGFSETLDPRYNFMGKPTMRTHGYATRLLNPAPAYDSPGHPVWKELTRLGSGFMPMSEKQGAVDLTQFESKSGKSAYRRLNELLDATGVEARLTKAVESSSYARLSDTMEGMDEAEYKGSKIGMLQKILDGYRTRAKGNLLREDFASKSGLSLSDALRNDKRNRRTAMSQGMEQRPIK